MSLTNNSAFVLYMGASRPPGGCEIYRGNLPMYALEKYGKWKTGWGFASDVFQGYGSNRLTNLIYILNKFKHLILPRAFIPNEEGARDAMAIIYSMVRSLRTNRIIYEVDDDYTNVHRQVVGGDSITPARWADAVTVTTPYLAHTMKRASKRPVYILPNSLDKDIWGKPSEKWDMFDGCVTIGLTGSPTHENDWAVLAPVLGRVLSEHPHARLILMGYHPPYLLGLTNTAYMGFMPYTEYAQVIKQCDIILCPVAPDDGFNLGKSEIKAVEGMGAGAAVIATNNEVYKLAVEDGKTGLLVAHNSESWYNAIVRLLRDETLRNELASRGRAWAWENRDIGDTWRLWANAYTKIAKYPSNQSSLRRSV